MFKKIFFKVKRYSAIRRRLAIAYEALREIANDSMDMIYVDSGVGSDANDGSLESPLCTLKQAQMVCDGKDVFVFDEYPLDRKTLITSRYSRLRYIALGAIKKMKEIK